MILKTAIQLYCASPDSGDGEWRTINGHHVFIREGETPKQALMRTLKQTNPQGGKKEAVPQKGKGLSSKDFKKKLDDFDPDVMRQAFLKKWAKPTKEEPTPKVLYHLTPQSALDGISKKGILGREEGSVKNVYEAKRPYPVYSYTDLKDTGRLKENLLDQGDIPKSKGNNLVVMHYKPEEGNAVTDDGEFRELLNEDEGNGHPWGGRVVIHDGDVGREQVIGYQKVNRDGSLGTLQKVNWGRK